MIASIPTSTNVLQRSLLPNDQLSGVLLVGTPVVRRHLT